MERVQTPVLVNLHLWFCTASFLYLTLMCVGLWGKPDWGEVTRLRLPVVVDQETRRWQPSAARLQHSPVCAATCRANVLRRAHRQRVLGKPSRWAMNQKWEAWLCFFLALRTIKSWSPQQMAKPHKWFSCLNNFVFCLHTCKLAIPSSVTVLGWIWNPGEFPPASGI